jgi:hypothetical protein
MRRARSVEAALPWLSLKGIPTGNMSEALQVLVGKEVWTVGGGGFAAEGALGPEVRPVAAPGACMSARKYTKFTHSIS